MVFYQVRILAELLKRTQKTRHKTYLISGILRENQAFKWYGGFTEKRSMLYLLLYKMKVQKIYYTLGKTNVAISGDTRFDRVPF
jgi:3-deoxy-D-manno-octulosonic-acid transferase